MDISGPETALRMAPVEELLSELTVRLFFAVVISGDRAQDTDTFVSADPPKFDLESYIANYTGMYILEPICCDIMDSHRIGFQGEHVSIDSS
jgi:hypothetical protein